MAELIKQQHELVVLKSWLDRTREPELVLDVEVHGGELVAQERLPAEEFGLPLGGLDPRSHDYPDDRFDLADEILRKLRSQEDIQRAREIGAPLWLQFTPSHPYLPLAPWESLLARLEMPILRLPYFAVPPATTPKPVTLVLCASSPLAKEPIPLEELVPRCVSRLAEGFRGQPQIHVFADGYAYDAIRHSVNPTAAPYVEVHEPPPADAYAIPRATGRIDDLLGGVSNPWLQWIKAAMKDGADVLHFICHGYLSMDQGAVALAESPAFRQDVRWSRFVGSNQLADFLTRMGAWACGFTSPPANYSKGALRLLADQLARLRPGPVLVHDSEHDYQFNALFEAHRFLFERPGTAPVSPRALALNCHPGWLGHTEPRLDEASDWAGAKLKRLVESPEPTPAWMTTAQRYVELWEGRLGEERNSPEVEAARRALGYAKSVLDDVVAGEAHTGEEPGQGEAEQ